MKDSPSKIQMGPQQAVAGGGTSKSCGGTDKIIPAVLSSVLAQVLQLLAKSSCPRRPHPQVLYCSSVVFLDFLFCRLIIRYCWFIAFYFLKFDFFHSGRMAKFLHGQSEAETSSLVGPKTLSRTLAAGRPQASLRATPQVKLVHNVCVLAYILGLIGFNIQVSQGCGRFFSFTFAGSFSFRLLVCSYKTRKTLLHLPPWEGSKTTGSMYIHSGRVPLPAVLPKVQQHRSETLYVPTEIKTPQVDGLVRTSGLTQALHKLHPQPSDSVPRSPTSDFLKHQ